MPAEAATEQKQTFRREIDLGDGSGKQVFEAESQDALIDKLAEAQVHATKKIREQAHQLEARQEVVEEVPPDSFDKQKWFGQLYEDPLTAIDQYMETRFGLPPEQLAQKLGQIEQSVNQSTLNSVANEFASRHPEIFELPEADKQTLSTYIEGVVKENNLPWTGPVLDMAYAHAVSQGKVKPKQQQEDQPIVPVTLTSKRGAQASAVSDEDERRAMSRMTRPELEEYLRKKHGDRVFGG